MQFWQETILGVGMVKRHHKLCQSRIFLLLSLRAERKEEEETSAYKWEFFGMGRIPKELWTLDKVPDVFQLPDLVLDDWTFREMIG